MKLGVNKRKFRSYTNLWTLSNTHLNGQWVVKESQNVNLNIFETNENRNIIPKTVDYIKAVLRER